MSRKKPARDWTYVKEIPAEITGLRRELMEMMLRATVKGEAQFTGSSPRTWKFVFPDTGGWSTEREIRQDQIKPSTVASILNGEAFSSDHFEGEMMALLRRLVKP